MPHQTGDILLDKYRIEALIGRGAFAQVYLVTHLGLNVPRAVKILRRDTPGVGSTEYSDFRERFRLEAQLGARLNTPTPHPNLLQIHDFQQVDDLLVLEMEYASSGSLAERIEWAKTNGQPIPVERAVQMGLDVAQGLGAIHALDAVHRDLKPSNILFDAQGTAKVADLGLAQIPGGPSMRSKLSQAAPHPGTPGYMSPEQERSGSYLRPSSDVYALGLVLFEVLSKRNYHHLKPGTRVSDLRPDVPGWLDDLFAHMLAEEPKERPWEGAEVAELLHEGQEREARRKGSEKRKADEQSRLAEEKTRQEAEKRAAEISRLCRETETAIAAGQWRQAERLIRQMESMGEEGQAEADRLRDLLAEAQRKAQAAAKRKEEQHKQEIERLEAQDEAALECEDWGRIRELCSQLERLGAEGQASAQRFRVRARTRGGLRWLIPSWGWWAAGLIGVVVVIFIIILVFNGGKDVTPTPEPAVIAAATFTPKPTEFLLLAITNIPKPTSTQTTRPSRTPTKISLLTATPRPSRTPTKIPPPTATLQPSRTPTDISTPTQLSSEIIDDFGVAMVLVPAGSFEMGGERCDLDSRPVHTITLDDYYIDKYEVTNALFAQFLNAQGNQVEGDVTWLDTGAEVALIEQSSDEWVPNSGYADHPVVEVSWYGASSYCRWRGARLPTEAEWEKAARGIGGRIFPFVEFLSCDLAQYSSCSGSTKPVGSFPEGASPYGVLDMAGNVNEWIADWYEYGYYASSPESNPQGPSSGEYRVMRGGSWRTYYGYLPSYCRLKNNPDNTYDGGGFRCARSP